MTKTQGAFAVIINSEKQVLLVRLTERFEYAWNFPGGILEPGENHEQAAVRETLEETGITCQILNKIDELTLTDLNLHFYKCKYKSGKIKLQLEEITDAGWFNKSDALKLKLAFDIRRRIEQYL